MKPKGELGTSTSTRASARMFASTLGSWSEETRPFSLVDEICMESVLGIGRDINGSD